MKHTIHPMIRHLLSCIVFFFLISPISAQTNIPYGNNPEAGHYVSVNGIRLYYETYGSGKPLVLLHGNGGSIRSQRGRIPYFQQYFKVIAIDSRSQGKSLDATGKKLTYDQMASDVKVLLDSLHIDSAYIWGQSDGGVIGLILASKYPSKVARLATFGANTFPGNKAVYDEIETMVKDTLRLSKDPYTLRLYDLLEHEPHITTADLHKISAPTLLMAGDRDVIRPEHTQMIFDNIPNANLFIMPGATHAGSYEKPDLFNLVLMDFFTKPFLKKSSVELFTGKKL